MVTLGGRYVSVINFSGNRDERVFYVNGGVQQSNLNAIEGTNTEVTHGEETTQRGDCTERRLHR